ncbi:ABC transporter permease [Bifidobacterium avesanii]|uniref:ABC transporter permease n=1 Tax=Bifidobacterium avesanii TaxID=1798157 RepID=A0A7K3TJ64_9BIFI|nr:ABC transporter permease [Bifidobacterium avesanii]KAB8293550.1 ABC transporter permease [Bifidobacterium avesanii]NEG78313.1 ABC transporter permease [Bifidobacterium avesanii]
MGRHQRAETSGLISFLVCSLVCAVAMKAFVELAPPIWQVSRRLFTVSAGMITACGVLSFAIGYARHSRSWNLDHGWFTPIRRAFEVLALSIVYASTIFLCAFAILGVISSMMGSFLVYLPWITAGFAGVVGYLTFVQADLMNAKTIASLLPFFVLSGVTTAGLTTDDPYWYNNNFSQLGDRTTFAARMFNSTLILAGVCIIIVSYFAVSELITTHRLRVRWQSDHADATAGRAVGEIAHFRLRAGLLMGFLTLAGLFFIGIGTFRYTPHPHTHDFFARGLPMIMSVLLIILPWLAPQLSKATFVIGDLAIGVCGVATLIWLKGDNTLTNVEALSGLVFLGWFIVFARQIAAIEADRVAAQLVYAQLHAGGSPRPASASASASAAEAVATVAGKASAAASTMAGNAGFPGKLDRVSGLESRLPADR